jgi:thiol-disulfide isomerase/thioredoxin
MSETKQKEPTDADFGPNLEYEMDRTARKPTLMLWYAEYCGACIYFRKNDYAETAALAAKLGVVTRTCDTDTHTESMMKLVELNGSPDLFVPLFVLFNAPGQEKPILYKGLAKPQDIAAWLRTSLALGSMSSSSASSSSTTATSSSQRRATIKKFGASKSVPETVKKSAKGDVKTSRETEEEGEGDATEEHVADERESKVSIPDFHDRDSLNVFLRRHDRGTVVLQWHLLVCGACQDLARYMETWNHKYGSKTLVFAKADADDIVDAPWIDYPVTQILRNGKIVETIRGYRPTAVETELRKDH